MIKTNLFEQTQSRKIIAQKKGFSVLEYEKDLSVTPQMAQESSVNLENCIILRGDQILIDDHPVDMDFVKGYVEERIDTNTVITIVDDYSTSSLHHEVTELCEEKGMKPENMTYEEWAEQ